MSRRVAVGVGVCGVFHYVDGRQMTTDDRTRALANQAKAMAAANTVLRKIAAHVPAAIWLKAKEEAGFGTEIHAQISDPKIDEAWLEFVASGCDTKTDRARIKDAIRAELVNQAQRMVRFSISSSTADDDIYLDGIARDLADAVVRVTEERLDPPLPLSPEKVDTETVKWLDQIHGKEEIS